MSGKYYVKRTKIKLQLLWSSKILLKERIQCVSGYAVLKSAILRASMGCIPTDFTRALP